MLYDFLSIFFGITGEILAIRRFKNIFLPCRVEHSGNSKRKCEDRMERLHWSNNEKKRKKSARHVEYAKSGDKFRRWLHRTDARKGTKGQESNNKNTFFLETPKYIMWFK